MRLCFLIIAFVHAQIGSLELFPSINTIQAQTTYELKFLLQQDMPINSIITVDFSSTDIIVTDGTLSKCTGSIYFTSASTDYTQCSCSSKICTITISSGVPASSLYLLKFGLLTNPSFVKPQPVSLTVNFLTIQQTQAYTVDVYQAGDLTLNSVSQSSFKVSDLNNVKLIVQSQHSIEQNGHIVLTFPSEIIFTKLSVLVEVNSLNYTGSLATSGQSVTVSNIFSSLIVAASQFTIYLLNVQNQESIKTSSQIVIHTATQNSYLIDQVGVSISTTIPENIVIQYVNTLDTQIVNKLATYQFTLQPVLKFTNGGYLEIQFPVELTIESNMTCQRIIGLTLVSGTTYSCTYSGQNVRTTNLQYPNTANSMILTVSNIINPPSTKPTLTFQFRTYDLDGNLMCVSSTQSLFTATAGSLTATLTRSATTVAVQSQYTVAFTNSDSIPNGGYININLGTQASKQTTQALQCSDSSNNIISCQYTSDSVIQIMTTKIIAQNTETTIILSYLINPNYVITATSDFSISTADTFQYTIDKLNNIPITPILTPINMLSIVYYRNNDKLTSSSILNVGTTTIVELQFQVSSSYILQNDGNAIINLNGHYYLNSGETIACTQIISDISYSKSCVIQSYITQTAPVMYLISEVKISNIISNGNANIDIIISGVRSELKAGSIVHQITISLYTLGNQLVSSGINQLGNTQLINNVVALNQLSINSDSQITNKLSQYTIKHTLKYPLDIQSRNGYIQLILPTDVGVDSINSCLATISSNTLACSHNANILTITSNLSPYQIGQELIISINQIRNPYSTAITSAFKFQYYYDSTLSVESDATYSVTQPNTIQVSVQRSPTLIDEVASLSFTMTLDNQVDSLNYNLQIQTDQLIPTQLSIQQNNAPIAAQIDTLQNGFISFKFKESTCPCNSGTTLSFFIAGLRNPLLSSASVASLSLVDDNSNIYEQNQIITMPGITLGSIQIGSLTQTGNQLNSQTSITISITNDTPMDNSEVIIQFDPNNLPFIPESNIIITLNTVQTICTIDQSKYSITCQNVQIKSTNIIVISGVSTIKWLYKNPNCVLSISTFFNNNPLDSLSGFNCNSLTNLQTMSFDSTIARSNRILNQNSDLVISFTHEISSYITIKLPLTDILNDPLFSYSDPLLTHSTLTTNSQYLIIQLSYSSPTVNQIVLNNLQNANSLLQAQSKYIIELSNDGQTVSYTSQGVITPELMCQGSQCSNQQLTILSYSKSSTIIQSRTDLQLNIQLPDLLKQIVSISVTMSETSIDQTSQCYLNGTSTNCGQLIKQQCALCEQTQVTLAIKNALNQVQFNPLEKVCINIETESELAQVCSSFPQTYSYLLDVNNVNWSGNSFFTSTAQLEMNFKLISPLSGQYPNQLQFTNINNQVDFTNSQATINDQQQTITYQNNLVSISLCKSDCDTTQIYDLKIFPIKLLEQYTYSNAQSVTVSIMQSNQQLEQSSNILLYPKTLTPNSLTITGTAEDYVQLNYTLQSSVPYQSQSVIKIIFQNNNCVSQGAIGNNILMSTCSLKDNAIISAYLIYKNQITHQSSEQITLTVANDQCPISYVNYKDNCYTACPASTYLDNNICKDCLQTNCNKCTADSCLTCNTNYELENNKCSPTCLIENCEACSNQQQSQQQCISCQSPYQLYNNTCKLQNDCVITNCDICQIENQSLHCIQCTTGKVKLMQTCLDKCPAKYYSDKDNLCQVCSSGCQTCSTLATCTECQSQYNLIDAQCKCKIDGCQICTSVNKCDSCQPDKSVYFGNQCLSDCPAGYYLDGNTCSECDKACTTCNSQKCLTCQINYFLENEKCIEKVCITNCQQCENNNECQLCLEGYEKDDKKQCQKILHYPYFGNASLVFSVIIIVGIGYQIVSILLPPKLLIFPQIILSTIVIFSSLSTVGNLILILYSYISEEAIIFVLSAVMFCITNIYHSQTSFLMNNPLLTFLTSGTWIRTPLLKMKYLSKPNPQQLTNYQLIRQTNKYDHLITSSLSVILGVTIISLQTPNEIPFIAIIKVIIDILLLLNFTLEKRLI